MICKVGVTFACIVGLGAGPSAIAGGGVAHSVTGSGHVQDGPVLFWQAMAVHQSSDGTLRGTLQVQVDLSAFGLGKLAFNTKPTCLVVDGDRAWIGTVVIASNDTDFVPIGTETISFVQDLGGEGEDIVHGEFADFFPPGTTCEDRPAMPNTIAYSGNVHVQ